VTRLPFAHVTRARVIEFILQSFLFSLCFMRGRDRTVGEKMRRHCILNGNNLRRAARLSKRDIDPVKHSPVGNERHARRGLAHGGRLPKPFKTQDALVDEILIVRFPLLLLALPLNPLLSTGLFAIRVLAIVTLAHRGIDERSKSLPERP